MSCRSLVWPLACVTLLGAVTFAAAAQAHSWPAFHAAPPTVQAVIPDEHGMPQCLILTDHDALVLKWNHDMYQRDIYVERASVLSRRSHFSGDAFDDKRPCADYTALAARLTDKDSKWTPGSAVLFGVSLSAWTQAALLQISKGGNIFHSETTATQYLTTHLLGSYTRAVDQDLSRKFGMGFTAEIYRAFLQRRPEYQTFATRVETHMPDAPTALSQRTAGWTIMLANGYMNGVHNDRLKPLEDLLRGDGLNVVVFKMDTIGPMKANVPLLKAQIIAQAETSDKLILMGASKGAPELLQAIVALAQDNPNVVARIKGVVNLSGMMDGSFLLDWGNKFPQKIFVEAQMKKGAKSMGVDLKTMDGLWDMTSKALAKVIPETLPHLPDSAVYFNVLGVPGDNGLVRDKAIETLQGAASRTQVGMHGANDGYIEFPGTEIPNDLGLSLYTITFNSSHVLLDGWYGKHDLNDAIERTAVLRALFSAILDLID